MIAVLANRAEHPIVREFFELFKTPWEFYRSDREYQVLLSSSGNVPENSAKLVIVYGSQPVAFDRENGVEIYSERSNTVASFHGSSIPIYGKCLTFASGPRAATTASARRAPVVDLSRGEQQFVRIGYDLFQEILQLLTRGQPPAHASTPALELHIALLRDLIVGHSIPLIEIPAVPAGHNFIACLTHDVDHFGVRNHKWDHTMFGFLYRATFGSVLDVVKRRKSARQLAANVVAALSLPLVHVGLARDFWHTLDRYLEIEKGLTSTFFVLPRKGDPGQSLNGPAP